jgi:hypothetical protein
MNEKQKKICFYLSSDLLLFFLFFQKKEQENIQIIRDQFHHTSMREVIRLEKKESSKNNFTVIMQTIS